MGLLLHALHLFYRIISFLILARVIVSWFAPNPYNPNPAYQVLFQLTEPILAPCRKLLDRFQGRTGLDFSPILALFLLSLVYRLLFSILAGIAR